MSITSLGKKLAVMMVAAFAACLLSASVAFADTGVTVKFNDLLNSNNQPYQTTVTLEDYGNTAGSLAFGQYYKNGWNVLATGRYANDYATVESVLQAALDAYNEDMDADYALEDVIESSGNAVQMVSGTPYTKYYLKYADVFGLKDAQNNSLNYFYNLAKGADSEFSSSVRSSSWNLGTVATGIANPVSYAAVIAMNYGKASDSASSTSTCAALALTAYNSEGNDSGNAPRIIIPGYDGGSVAGNRFCSSVAGFVVL